MKKNNTIKRFELNKSVLKDFDRLMSMNLGEVEELIVTEIDKDNKILNIISLCLNIKTLVIDGNQRIDTSAVLHNICKPNLLESIVLRNVKRWQIVRRCRKLWSGQQVLHQPHLVVNRNNQLSCVLLDLYLGVEYKNREQILTLRIR